MSWQEKAQQEANTLVYRLRYPQATPFLAFSLFVTALRRYCCYCCCCLEGGLRRSKGRRLSLNRTTKGPLCPSRTHTDLCLLFPWRLDPPSLLLLQSVAAFRTVISLSSLDISLAVWSAANVGTATGPRRQDSIWRRAETAAATTTLQRHAETCPDEFGQVWTRPERRKKLAWMGNKWK